MPTYFQPGRPLRKPAKLSHAVDARRRKLRLERMEGRLMLSATTGEYALSEFKVDIASNWDVLTYFDAASTNLSLASGGNLASANDGGLITSDVNTPPRTNNDYTSHFEPDAPLLTNTDGYSENLGEQFSTTAAGANNAWTNTGGLRPIGFVTAETGKIESPPNRVATTTGLAASASEGGSIALSSLLAEVRSEQSASSGSSIVAGSSIDATPKAAKEHSTKSLSGEWARAAVFSMVGNDRDVVASAAYYRMHSTSNNRSTNDGTPAANDRVVQPGAAQQPAATESKARNKPAAQESEASNSQPAAVEKRTANASRRALPVTWNCAELRPAAVLTPVMLAEQVAVRIANEKRNANDLVVGYDELGKEPTASGSSVNKLWQRKALATPLLLVLALERLAAIKSGQKGKAAVSREGDGKGQPHRFGFGSRSE